MAGAQTTDGTPVGTGRSTIAVVGLGRVGGIAAAWLQHAGRHDVTVCARRPLTKLTLEHDDGTFD